MFLQINKNLRSLLQKLGDEQHPTLAELQTTYSDVLKLRSQLLGVISSMEHYGTSDIATVALAKRQAHGKTLGEAVVLTIDEPLPHMKELTADLHEHWLKLMQMAISQAQNGSSEHLHFEKAFVLIKVVTLKGTNNTQLWDTSNRAVNLILNNLKGIYFEDDNLEHLAFGVVGSWGEKSATMIRISDYEKLQPHFYEHLEKS